MMRHIKKDCARLSLSKIAYYHYDYACTVIFTLFPMSKRDNGGAWNWTNFYHVICERFLTNRLLTLVFTIEI